MRAEFRETGLQTSQLVISHFASCLFSVIRFPKPVKQMVRQSLTQTTSSAANWVTYISKRKDWNETAETKVGGEFSVDRIYVYLAVWMDWWLFRPQLLFFCVLRSEYFEGAGLPLNDVKKSFRGWKKKAWDCLSLTGHCHNAWIAIMIIHRWRGRLLSTELRKHSFWTSNSWIAFKVCMFCVFYKRSINPEMVGGKASLA